MPSFKPTRKKQSSKPALTLDAFFSGTPKAKIQDGLPNKKRNNIVTKEMTHPQVNMSAEIIVIDSDSDDELQIREVIGPKRRKVEKGLAESANVNKQSILPASVTSNHEPSTISFGHLIHLSSQALDIKPSISNINIKDISFGEPTSLLSESTTRVVAKQEHNNASLPCSSEDINGKEVTDDVQAEATTLDDDEWEVGDDELAFLSKLDNDWEDTPGDVEPSLLGCDIVMGNETLQHLGDPIDSGPSISAQSTINDCKITSSYNDSSRITARGSNAFKVLMSSFKENEVWKEATVVEDKTFHPVKANGGRRKAPFYKVLQGMPIAVDAFRYGSIPGVKAYFLTHAHSDHYTNLSSNWKNGPIYCSTGTANLIIHMLSVDPKWVKPLPMDTPTIIPDTSGVCVTLIEANHCPGSCLFFFEGPQTVNAGDSSFKSPFVGTSRIFKYLHCGDFRASPRHVMHPAIKGKRIDHIYLDTTYLDPRYTFPPQPLVISACAEFARRVVSGESMNKGQTLIVSWAPKDKPILEKTQDKILVVVGTYSIGKERIVKAIAHTLRSKVYCDARKAAILRCENDTELNALLTSDPLEAMVHIVPLGTITSDRLKIYMERYKGIFSKVIGFRPTGWTYSQPTGTNQIPSVSSIISNLQHREYGYENLTFSRQSTANMQLVPIPYSEHSSFYELTCFAMSCDWDKMIATVNVGSETSRGKMTKWIEKWEAEKRKRGRGYIVEPRHSDYW